MCTQQIQYFLETPSLQSMVYIANEYFFPMDHTPQTLDLEEVL